VGAGCRRLDLGSPGRVRLVRRLRWEQGLVEVGIAVAEGIGPRSLMVETCFVALMAAAAAEGASRTGTGVCPHSVCNFDIAGAEAVMRLAVVD